MALEVEAVLVARCVCVVGQSVVVRRDGVELVIDSHVIGSFDGNSVPSAVVRNYSEELVTVTFVYVYSPLPGVGHSSRLYDDSFRAIDYYGITICKVRPLACPISIENPAYDVDIGRVVDIQHVHRGNIRRERIQL